MNYLFIDTHVDRAEYVIHELMDAAASMGHSVFRLPIVRGANLLEENTFREFVIKFNPDRIVWLATTGFPYHNVLDNIMLGVPRIVLMFDEPFMRFRQQDFEPLIVSCSDRDDYHFFCWDGYWISRMKKQWGVTANLMHLAANVPKVQPKKLKTKCWDSSVVFWGMLQSPKAICEAAATLNPINQERIQKIDQELSNLSYVEAWKTTVKCGEEWIDQFGGVDGEKDQRKMRWIVWAMAKNAVRVAVLRTVLRQTPVLMFCDTKQLSHANEAEIFSMIKRQNNHPIIVDTSRWDVALLEQIPLIGSLHIQATDPQSVFGGIPLRMFQCGAVGRRVFTDSRPELEGVFLKDHDYWSYLGESLEIDLACTIDTFPHEPLVEKVRMFHQWTNRINQIEETLLEKRET